MNMNNTNNTIETFKVGEEYACRSIGDWECIYHAKVIRRTAKTVTFEESFRGVYTRKINADLTAMEGCECLYPHGQFSMAPIFRAKYTLAKVRAA